MIVGIGIDGSQDAERAFETYLKHWHQKENTVLLLHAFQMDFSTGDDEMIVGEMTGLILSHKWQKVLKETRPLQAKYELKLKEHGVSGKWVNIEEEMRRGEAIVHAASRMKIDVLVVGSRGLGSFRRTILGSVSDYVLHHSRVPVIVCRLDKRPEKLHTHNHRHKHDRHDQKQDQSHKHDQHDQKHDQSHKHDRQDQKHDKQQRYDEQLIADEDHIEYKI